MDRGYVFRLISKYMENFAVEDKKVAFLSTLILVMDCIKYPIVKLIYQISISPMMHVLLLLLSILF